MTKSVLFDNVMAFDFVKLCALSASVVFVLFYSLFKEKINCKNQEYEADQVV